MSYILPRKQPSHNEDLKNYKGRSATHKQKQYYRLLIVVLSQWTDFFNSDVAPFQMLVISFSLNARYFKVDKQQADN